MSEFQKRKFKPVRSTRDKTKSLQRPKKGGLIKKLIGFICLGMIVLLLFTKILPVVDVTLVPTTTTYITDMLVKFDTETKEYEITVGTPPASQLIKSEMGIKTGSGKPNLEKCGIIAVEQVIKVANMKDSSFFAKNLKNSMKIVLGSCRAMGLLVEGKPVQEFMVDLDAGKYDDVIAAGKTEVDAEKLSDYKAKTQEMQKILIESKKASKEAEAAEEAKKK